MFARTARWTPFAKVFWFFFSKKNTFLTPPRHAADLGIKP
jgi:hypothetical protein